MSFHSIFGLFFAAFSSDSGCITKHEMGEPPSQKGSGLFYKPRETDTGKLRRVEAAIDRHAPDLHRARFLIQDKMNRGLNHLKSNAASRSPSADQNMFFGEEEGRYVSPHLLNSGRGQRGIQGGSLSKIVEYIINASREEFEELGDVLLLTYHSFVAPYELLNEIENHWEFANQLNVEVPVKDYASEITANNIAQLIRKWCLKYTEDWIDWSDLLTQLQDFASRCLRRSHSPSKLIQTTINDLCFKLSTESPPPPLSRVPPTNQSAAIRWVQINARSVAEQFTLLEWNLFNPIRPRELLNTSWKQANTSEKQCPNLSRWIKWSIETRDWVGTLVKNAQGSQSQTAVVKHFMNIATELLELNNVNGAIWMWKGITDPQTGNLMANVQPNEPIRHISELIQPIEEYKVYRKWLKKRRTSCIPYIVPLLAEMAAMDQLMPDYLGQGSYNFKKSTLVAAAMLKFFPKYEAWQRPYVIQIDRRLQGYLLDARILPREQIWPDESVDDDQMLLEGDIGEETRSVTNGTESDPLFPDESPADSSLEPSQEENAMMLPPEDYEKLLSISETNVYDAGEYLITQGEYNTKLFIVKRGHVRVLKSVKGTEFRLSELGPNKVFGDVSVLMYGVASASVVTAEDDVEIIEIEVIKLPRLFRENPELGITFFGNMVRTLVKRLMVLPIPSAESNGSRPLQSKSNTKFLDTFHLPGYEPLVREFKVRHYLFKRGRFFLSPNFFALLTVVFSQKKVKRRESPTEGEQLVIPIENVRNVELTRHGRIKIHTNEPPQSIVITGFRSHTESKDCWNIMNRIVESFQRQTVANSQSPGTSVGEAGGRDSFTMSKHDWSILLRGATKKVYHPDQIVVRQGSKRRRLYFISTGACKAVARATADGRETVLNMMSEEEIFGEVSFFSNSPASASVIATEEPTEIYTIDSHYIKSIIASHPKVVARFFSYIGTLLAYRLQSREARAWESSEQEQSMDISALLTPGKVYPSEKSGYIMQRNRSPIGDNWEKRYCEVVNGFFIVYGSDHSFSNLEAATESEYSIPERESTMSSYSHSQSHAKRGGRVYKVIPLSGMTLEVAKTASSLIIKLNNARGVRTFKCDTLEEISDWIGTLYQWTNASYRYGSYAPIRENVYAESLVDGENAFRSMREALELAKESIFITDWWIIPELYLLRDHPASVDNRLDRILARKASQGVKVYIMVWNETNIATKLASAVSRRKLEALCPGMIFVIRHPTFTPFEWSHHQKTMVIDQEIGFVGGLDLCYGRWDTQKHNCTDSCHLNTLWPGKDYYNTNIKAVDKPEEPFVDHLDRATIPRLPWHDVHLKIQGSAVSDLAFNFIQRWNHHKELNNDYAMHPYILPKSITEAPLHNVVEGTANVQLLRSLSPWSSGYVIENSLHQAYCDMILKSEYYVYIENQFFISGTAGGGVLNKVGQAIVDRVSRAIEEDTTFKCIVVMPIVPEGVYQETASIRYIMRWQYDTIWNGQHSIFGQLKRRYPLIEPAQYISFHSLRSHGILGTEEVTEQIYIHAKLMIVDDCKVMISSANINDRSLRGDGDSEIGAIIEDTRGLKNTMDNETVMVAKFAYDLRINLWAEHLGLSETELGFIQDPIGPETMDYWRMISSANTEIYSNCFPTLPSNKISTLQQLSSAAEEPVTAERRDALRDVKGHLVDFPLEFLQHENMKPDLKLKIVDRIFQ
ncbi:hypothetical protein PROFUN_12247 [Planoprotostelium fungivorum]|uniref:phospholipase D n=1 Tax=Planoprotostelium fungivorum TaxID=1890364 RepID=A0A2P6N819_9EUKA|nr:hypothetical protein PROFUN_12247 [Planoprotostelium fungivorum]